MPVAAAPPPFDDTVLVAHATPRYLGSREVHRFLSRFRGELERISHHEWRTLAGVRLGAELRLR